MSVGNPLQVEIVTTEEYGEIIRFEDHLMVVKRLEHVIDALENQLKEESKEILELKKKLSDADDLIYELSQE